MTFIELYNIRAALAPKASEPMPFALGYKIAKILQLCDNELKFYEEKRTQLIEKYCERDEEGNPKQGEQPGTVMLQMDKIEDIQKEIKELEELEVNVELPKLKIESLEAINFAPAEIIALEQIIEE